jgi:hypothetical protein
MTVANDTSVVGGMGMDGPLSLNRITSEVESNRGHPW